MSGGSGRRSSRASDVCRPGLGHASAATVLPPLLTMPLWPAPQPKSLTIASVSVPLAGALLARRTLVPRCCIQDTAPAAPCAPTCQLLELSPPRHAPCCHPLHRMHRQGTVPCSPMPTCCRRHPSCQLQPASWLPLRLPCHGPWSPSLAASDRRAHPSLPQWIATTVRRSARPVAPPLAAQCVRSAPKSEQAGGGRCAPVHRPAGARAAAIALAAAAHSRQGRR